jgi:hypothetical protein
MYFELHTIAIIKKVTYNFRNKFVNYKSLPNMKKIRQKILLYIYFL